MQTQDKESTATHPPTIAALVRHTVTDFAAWKAAFDAHQPARAAAGILGHHINRSAEDPNELAVYLPAADETRLNEFLSSADLKAAMKDAGVAGPPSITRLRPVEDLTRKEDGFAGCVITHAVADYDVWKKGFDAHGDARAAAGIVGHAVNRGGDNDLLVVAYLQAKDVSSLQAFLNESGLKEAMIAAGVQGQPKIVLTNGGEWVNY